MNAIINRDRYLNKMIAHKHNHLIKIITGVRRCGKSFLLFQLFKQHLIASGVEPSHIIEIALDNRIFKEFRNPDNCLHFVLDEIKDKQMYYLLIDEVQLMDEFEDVLNSFLHVENLDVFVTGSNSRFLSTDIITEFRGRGDEIRLFPLSFSEFSSANPDLSWEQAWSTYSTYGGMPYIVARVSSLEEKAQYLKQLFTEIYLKDILERNSMQGSEQMEALLNILASNIGSLTNPNKLAAVFKSESKITLSAATIKQYIDYLRDAFIIERAERYDIKGNKYISTPHKYYFSDIGLRNARINFRQNEETHIMENVIYNELLIRGYSVDVGVVEIYENSARKHIEIDFVVNKGSERIYIQSAFALPSEEKIHQELRPLISVRNSFKKIIIVKEDILLRRDSNGIITMGLRQFLMLPDNLSL